MFLVAFLCCRVAFWICLSMYGLLSSDWVISLPFSLFIIQTSISTLCFVLLFLDRTPPDFDIALVKIRSSNGRGITFNDYVQPACLPTNATSYSSFYECYISGWGDTPLGMYRNKHFYKTCQCYIMSLCIVVATFKTIMRC